MEMTSGASIRSIPPNDVVAVSIATSPICMRVRVEIVLNLQADLVYARNSGSHWYPFRLAFSICSVISNEYLLCHRNCDTVHIKINKTER